MRRWLILTCLAALLVAAGPSAQTSPTLRGYVTDANTGLPVRNASVSQGGKVVTFTDQNGRFEMSPVTGVQLMIVGKGGLARMMIVRQPALGELDVAMIRGASLMVHVLDGSGQPLPGAAVLVRCPNISLSVPSNELGIARIAGLGAGSCDVSAGAVLSTVSAGGPPGPEQLRAAADSLRARASQIEADRQNGAIRVDLSIGEERSFAIDGRVRRTTATPQPPLGTASIRGRVLSNGRPLPGARVSAIFATTQTINTSTGDDGTYEITGLPAGTVAVGANQMGFIDPARARRQVVVKDGEQGMADLLLVPGAVISGTVLDEYGDPMEGVRVEATRVADNVPGPPVTARSSGITDDRGQYRLVSLSTGAYRVSARMGRNGSSDPLFYPGRRDPTEAAQVTVAEPGETGGIDFVIPPDGPLSLSGTVTTSAGSAPAGGIARLTRVADSTAAALWSTSVRRDGRFLFADVPPGSYELTVTAAPGYVILTRHAGQAVQAPPIPSVEYARTGVTIGGASPVLNVLTAPGALLRGRVVLDDSAASVPLATLRLATSLDRNNAAAVAGDGTFELRGVAGVTRIDLASPLPGWWLRSFTIGAVNAADDPIDLSNRANSRNDVRAVLARTARIAGTVADAAGPAARVLVFPVEHDKRYASSRYVRTAAVAADGRYTVEVPPGQYWVVALASAASLSEAVLTQLESSSTTVSAIESREARADLRALRLTR